MRKYYNIAGLTVEMDSFGRTLKQAEPYQMDVLHNEPEIIISSKWLEGKKDYPDISDDDGEYIFTGISFYNNLLKHNGFMLHSSAIVVDGKAYLFSADPGTGKSTHTRLWLEHFGSRGYILNDDKPALRLVDGVWYAYGTPWSGKHDISVNVGVPVQGIAVLKRGETNEITRYDGINAIFDIFSQTNRVRKLENRERVLMLLDKLMTQVPVWKLKCNMDPEAAIVAYEAMSGQKYEGEWK